MRGGQKEVLDVSGAADLLDVSEETVRELARRGKLPGRKVGKEWRFSRPALMAWLAGSHIWTTLSEQAYFRTERWQQAEREADEDIAAGRLYPMRSGETPGEALRRLSEELRDE